MITNDQRGKKVNFVVIMFEMSVKLLKSVIESFEVLVH